MRVTVPATYGSEYRLFADTNTTKQYSVSRVSRSGVVHQIGFTRDDAIAVTNALIDMLEQDDHE